MHRRLFLLVLAVFPFAPRDVAAETDWTGWLGNNRDGWVTGFQTPETWPDQLRKKWTIEVGSGYGSPLVYRDLVYQHARQGEQEVVWCIDLQRGTVNWKKSYPAPFKMGGGGERHGKGPKSCPVIADGRLFVMSITGVVTAWNSETGDLLWRRDYQPEFEKGHPYWGASTSPIVDEGRLIVHFGNDDVGALIALDVKTGDEVWRHGKDGTSYSSPLLTTLGGIRQVVEWNHRALVGIESATGRFLWEKSFPHVGHNQNMPTPAIHDGKILLGGENRGLHCFEPVRQGDQWTVKENWYQEKVALDMSSAVMNDGLLFGFSHYGSGRLFCVDSDSGEVLWQGPGRSGQNVTFLSVPGNVLALVDDGRLIVIKVDREKYDPARTYRVADGETWAPLVLLKQGMLIKDKTSLTRWAFE